MLSDGGAWLLVAEAPPLLWCWLGSVLGWWGGVVGWILAHDPCHDRYRKARKSNAPASLRNQALFLGEGDGERTGTRTIYVWVRYGTSDSLWMEAENQFFMLMNCCFGAVKWFGRLRDYADAYYRPGRALSPEIEHREQLFIVTG